MLSHPVCRFKTRFYTNKALRKLVESLKEAGFFGNGLACTDPNGVPRTGYPLPFIVAKDLGEEPVLAGTRDRAMASNIIPEKDYADLRAARQSPERKRRTVKDMNNVREQHKAATSKAEKDRIAKAAGLFVRLPVSFHLTHSEILTCCKNVYAPSSFLSFARVVEDFNLSRLCSCEQITFSSQGASSLFLQLLLGTIASRARTSTYASCKSTH
jgi:hypothetical protein